MPAGSRALGGVFGNMLNALLRVVKKRPPAAKVLDGSRATHRASRDAIDRAARSAQVDDIARRQGVPASSLPKARPYNHPVTANTNRAVGRGADPAEVARQRDLYQNGMNSQTVDDALGRVKNKPSRPSTTAERGQMRNELAQQGYRDLRNAGYSASDARTMAQRYADEQFPSSAGHMPQAMLHNPDMHLGGSTPTHTYGDAGVNNALGHAAKGGQSNYRAYLEAEAAAGRGNHLVNVTLT